MAEAEEAKKQDFRNGFFVRDLADGAMAVGQVAAYLGPHAREDADHPVRPTFPPSPAQSGNREEAGCQTFSAKENRGVESQDLAFHELDEFLF